MCFVAVLVLGMKTMPNNGASMPETGPQKAKFAGSESESESEYEVGTFWKLLVRRGLALHMYYMLGGSTSEACSWQLLAAARISYRPETMAAKLGRRKTKPKISL